MTRHLHRLAAVLFYTLGLSFFGAYLLNANELYAPWPQWWLSIADLPLILCGLLYGGSSLYLSVTIPQKKSPILALVIIIPLLALFTFLFLLNYWELLGLPGGAA
ncbi:MAG TPA: hypothetical protein VJB10_05410 [Candidatus Peribacteraceae bacterium]|nr:hypothetical protein [Candidatus Peribacteraceae bacterium]